MNSPQLRILREESYQQQASEDHYSSEGHPGKRLSVAYNTVRKNSQKASQEEVRRDKDVSFC